MRPDAPDRPDRHEPSYCVIPLADVAEALEGAALWSYAHADVRAGDRLLLLSTCVEQEAEYERNVTVHGMERVPRQEGRSLGWLLMHDPDVRARRRALGVSVP